MVQLTKHQDDPLVWITFSSVNNTLGKSLIRQLDDLLEECLPDSDTKILILNGRGEKFFSPGLDLHEVSRLDRSGMRTFMEAFSNLYLKLFTYPKPVLAMLNGDALAGGFLLASCCLCRYGRPGINVGLTRLSRSLTMPYGSLTILAHLIGTRMTRKIALQGACFSARRAFQIGWLDSILPAQGWTTSMHLKALEFEAKEAGSRCDRSYEKRLKLAERIRREESRHLELFLDLWFSREAQLQIERTVKALSQRSGNGLRYGKDHDKGVQEV